MVFVTQRRPDVEEPAALPALPRLRPPTPNNDNLSQFARGTEPHQQALEQQDPAAQLAALEVKLGACLASLTMHFQPIVHAKGRARFAYEALLRSADKSLPHPGAILDAAERLEKIPTL